MIHARRLTPIAALAATAALAGCSAQEPEPTPDAASKAVAPGPAPCRPAGRLPRALVRCRNWIAYAPPAPFNPDQAVFPSEAQLERSLRRLAREGWRVIVTYSLDGTLSEVPRLARRAGFTKVVAGLFWYDEAQLRRERAAAVAERRHVDGYVLGNEGLSEGRYTLPQLRRELAGLRAATGRPVATGEQAESYRTIPGLARVGDWAFPIVHPWWAARRDPLAAARWTRREYCGLRALAPDRTWVIKESWWPTAGTDQAASGRNQLRFLRALLSGPLPAVQGEAYDQFWKQEPGGVGGSWGWHRADGRPKPPVAKLRRLYRGPRRGRACA